MFRISRLIKGSPAAAAVLDIPSKTFLLKSLNRCFGTIDHHNMSPVDVEKELFRMKRTMGTHYSNGSYGEALNVARALEIEIKDIMGSDNAVHASCINNIGLMLKMLGKLHPAMEHYDRALEMYEKAVGTHHMSYYSTLANIGVLCKTMSEASSTPEDYQSLLGRAQESLTTAIRGQRELAGINAKEVLVNENHLANIYKRNGRVQDAESQLVNTLEACRKIDQDSVTALTLNNLGVLLKEEGRFQEAEEMYKEALALRIQIGGERHNDSILVMHNMAELYAARGEEEKSNELRQKILDIMNVQPEPEKWSDTEVYESLPGHVRGEVPIEDKRPFFDPKIHGGRG